MLHTITSLWALRIVISNEFQDHASPEKWITLTWSAAFRKATRWLLPTWTVDGWECVRRAATLQAVHVKSAVSDVGHTS